MGSLRNKLLATSVLGAAAMAAMPAHAQMDPATAARIEALENKIQDLEIKLGSQVKEAQAKADQAVKAAGNAEYDGTDFEFDSPDGKHHFEIGGRIMVDAAWYNDDDNRAGNFDFTDGTEFRRARIFVEGKVYNDWKFKAQYDFADANFKDVWLAYTGFDFGPITVGQHKKPFGLEELTSSKYITFMERNDVNDAIGGGGRQIGISLWTGDDEMWGAAAGVFRGSTAGFGATAGGGEGYSLTGRAWVAPIHEKTMVVHLGGSIDHTAFDDVAISDLSTEAATHVDGFDPVDTDDWTLGARGRTSYGLEAAAVYGPFSVQGEYIRTTIKDGFHDDAPAGLNPQDYTFDGWYAFASFFLTGESRNYDVGDGSFGRVKPKSVVGEGGYGAWEVALRYSTLDLSDSFAQGGQLDDWTIGLNWYATKNVRFMANYVIADIEGATAQTGIVNQDLNILQFRAQIDF